MDLFTRQLDTHGRALELLAKRQQVLSSNIANADTPGYQARDFDFAAALAQARGGGAPGEIATRLTRPGHLASTAATPDARLQWRAPDQAALDGNTVDLDRERANFADNAVRYEATLRFINGHVKTMLSAISGQS